MSQASDNRGPGIIAAAIVAAAFILTWGLSGEEPRYQLASSGDGVVRMDNDSGEMIACNTQGCRRIEAPSRARTFGPVTVQIDRGEDEQTPAPANDAP